VLVLVCTSNYIKVSSIGVYMHIYAVFTPRTSPCAVDTGESIRIHAPFLYTLFFIEAATQIHLAPNNHSLMCTLITQTYDNCVIYFATCIL
jgi:hypothetical protein